MQSETHLPAHRFCLSALGHNLSRPRNPFRESVTGQVSSTDDAKLTQGRTLHEGSKMQSGAAKIFQRTIYNKLGRTAGVPGSKGYIISTLSARPVMGDPQDGAQKRKRYKVSSTCRFFSSIIVTVNVIAYNPQQHTMSIVAILAQGTTCDYLLPAVNFYRIGPMIGWLRVNRTARSLQKFLIFASIVPRWIGAGAPSTDPKPTQKRPLDEDPK